MKIGLIHFSDIHINSEHDFIIANKEAVAKACKAAVSDCTRVVVVITGDVANSGIAEEYQVAFDFLKYIEAVIKKESIYINKYEYVIVPGNHDCDFSKLDSIANIVRESVKKSDVVEDEKVISHCLVTQNEFWSFYGKLRGEEMEPTVSLSHTVLLTSTKSIHFNCYNSSFISERHETVGALIIPENCFLGLPVISKSDDIVVSLFHHNTGWLSPNTKNNNKKKFEQHILQTSNVIMCGHEHSANQKSISDISSNDEVAYFEGAALQNREESGFSVYIYDTDDNVWGIKDYALTKDYYSEIANREIVIKSRGEVGFLRDSFADKLNKIDIPIKHPIVKDLKLGDIFVWQDLETMDEIEDHCIQYIDAQDVITKSSGGIIYVEGESQSGKTSLLNMSYTTMINKGVLPILLSGNELSHPNVTELLKKKFKQQYQHEKYPYDKYEQLEREKKVLFIDDFNKCNLNLEGKSKLFENLLAVFSTVVFVSSIQNDVNSFLMSNSNKWDIKRYRLSSLGYHKRNLLIEKWIKLGRDLYTVDEFSIEQEVKLTFDQVTNLLGEQLVPSYPIFVLSLLQSLNQSFQQYDITQTSYAFCYKSLIIATLWRSGVAHDKLEGVINVLKEFAYSMYLNKTLSFTRKDFDDFYENYSKKYIATFSSDKLLEILIDSNILKEDEDAQIVFSYRYILYYLIARKLAVLDDKKVLDSIVSDLCENIHEEQSANIMIFLIHHTGSKDVIDNLLLTSMLPFENSALATLEMDDPLFRDLTGLVDEIKAEVLIENTDAKEEREKVLKESDDIQRQSEKRYDLAEVEESKEIRDLNNVFKIIRILGQIVKNQSTSFEKERLINIIEEAYKAGFRTIGFFTHMIDDNKEDIVRFFIEENQKYKKFDDHELEQKVRKLLQLMLYRNCLSTFSNLSFAVGNSGMGEIFDEVAKRIGSPAAKVVSFTIKSYYNKMKLSDLKALVEEFKGNPVVLEIIKARVIRYVYHNHIDVPTRQQIGHICNLKLINNPRIARAQVSAKKS